MWVTPLRSAVYRVWVPFAASVLFGAGTVVLAMIGTARPAAYSGAVAAGVAAVYCYRRALVRARGLPYRRAGVERNEDGTVGTPGPETDRSPGGSVDHDPFEDDPESFAFDGDFWTDADVDPGPDPGDGTGGRGRGATRSAGDGGRGRGVAATGDPRTREAREILGVAPGADAETVRRAYRERAKETHPDNGGDPEAFKRVRWAYEHLAARAVETEAA